jgi:hypothetical protein
MAVSLQEANAKWARNAVAGASRWHGDVNRYCEGLAKLGVNPATCMANVGAHYQQGIAAVGPSGFQAAIQQAAQTDRWARRWLERMNS